MPSARVMRRQVRLLLTPADNTKTPVRVHTHTHGTPVHTPADNTGPHALGRWCSPPRNVPGGVPLALPPSAQFQIPEPTHARTHHKCSAWSPLRSNRRPLVLLPHSRASLAPPPSLTRFALRSPPFSVVNVPGAPRRQGLAGAAGAPRPCLGRRRGAGLGQSLRRGRRRGGLVPSRRRGCPPRRGVCERVGLKP